MGETGKMKGYKVFNRDWKCRDFQYEVGKIYEMEESPIICERGFHFCKKLADCFGHYGFDVVNKVAEVEVLGEVDVGKVDSKCCTNKIHIVRELTWGEVLEMVNIGKECTGLKNSGHHNSGHHNSGSWNSGHFNSGDDNSGNYNSGDCNSGNCNSGDWNISSFSNGCFNTDNTKIFLFDKLSDWTLDDWRKSEARRIMLFCKYEENPQKWWNNLSTEDKDTIKNIPNFDKEIFKEITGIDVGRTKN